MPRLRRPRPDARRPHRRAPSRAPPGSSSSWTRRSSRRSSRSRARSRSACGGRTPTSPPGVTKQATRPAPARLDRPRGHRAGPRLPRADGLRRRRPARPARRAAAALAERARERADAGAAGADDAAGTTRPAAVRRQRVGCRARARGGGGDGDGVEATICAREFEIHVDLVVEPGADERADALEAALVERLEQWLFARDERRVEELVLSLAGARGLRLATAESCTGGLVAARLTGVPGSSESFVGGVVAYANAVKQAELDVPEELLATHGAVSAEVAAAMAEGARRRLGADVAVAVTGVAGPGGGTPEKPVGPRPSPCRRPRRLAGAHARSARRARAGARPRDRHRASSPACVLTGSRDEAV